MKRIIAGIIAMTAVMGILTGCGKDAADDAEESTTVETTAVSEEDTDDEEKTTEPTTEKASDKDSSSMTEEDTVREVAETFIDAYNERDYRQLFDMMNIDGYLDVVKAEKKVIEDKDEDESVIVKNAVKYLYTDNDNSLSDVKTIKKFSYDDTYLTRTGYNKEAYLKKFIEDNGGIEKKDHAEFEKACNSPAADFGADVEDIKAFRVTFEYTGETESGVGDMLVYSINDSGWKVDDVVFNANRSDEFIQSAQSVREYGGYELISSFHAADIDTYDYDTSLFIISSDMSRNKNVPDFIDVEEFVYMVNEGAFIGSEDWFIIAEGYDALLAVVSDSSNDLVCALDAEPDSNFSIRNEDRSSFIGDYEISGKNYDEIYEHFAGMIN